MPESSAMQKWCIGVQKIITSRFKVGCEIRRRCWIFRVKLVRVIQNQWKYWTRTSDKNEKPPIDRLRFIQKCGEKHVATFARQQIKNLMTRRLALILCEKQSKLPTLLLAGKKSVQHCTRSIGRVEMLSLLFPGSLKGREISFNRKSFTEVPPMRGALKDSKESCNLLNMCPKQYLICSCFLSVLPGHLNLGQLWSHIFDLLLCNVFERHIRSKFHGVLISHNSFLLCILKNGFLFLVQ